MLFRSVIKQRITKPSGTEKSAKVYNYPYQALEEAVVNALYHRDYKEREPVEITIEPTHIDILSYAGPDRSISYEAIKAARKLKARRYRNRRLGDFLKELDLTEGRATGIPTIQKHLRLNGNQLATIDTDDYRSFYLITIPCREDKDGTQQAEVSGKHTAADFDAQLSHEFGKAYAKVQQIASQCEAEYKAELLQLLLQMAVKVWNRSRHSDDKVYYCQAAVNLLQMLRNQIGRAHV